MFTSVYPFDIITSSYSSYKATVPFEQNISFLLYFDEMENKHHITFNFHIVYIEEERMQDQSHVIVICIAIQHYIYCFTANQWILISFGQTKRWSWICFYEQSYLHYKFQITIKTCCALINKTRVCVYVLPNLTHPKVLGQIISLLAVRLYYYCNWHPGRAHPHSWKPTQE